MRFESLASLVNLPSSFDSINDEDNFIYTDNLYGLHEKRNPIEQVIERRQDVKQINLEDIVASENEENGDMVTEELDNKIISAIEGILEISVPNDSKIRRKNSINRIIRRQNIHGYQILPSKDFVDVLPNGTSLVRNLF